MREKDNTRTILIVQPTAIRKLTVPSNAKKTKAKVLSTGEYEFIKTMSQKNSNLENHERDKEQNKTTLLIDEMSKIIEQKQREMKQLKDSQLQELEEEEKLKRNYMLNRAKELQFEREDEMKTCNSLILSAKCRSIQDAQVKEKESIKKRLETEENEMFSKMKAERQKYLEIILKAEDENLAKKQRCAKSILQQIREKETQNEEQIQRQRKEAAILKKLSEKLKQDEINSAKRQVMTRKSIKEENDKINRNMKEDAEKRQEALKMEELKIQEYLQKKSAELQEHRRQREKKKLEKKELLRLWMLQKKNKMLDDTKEEIAIQRIQDQIERKWREQEKEAVKKRIEELQKVKEIRDKQIFEKQTELASEIKSKNKELEIIRENIAKCAEEQKIKEKERLIKADKAKCAILHQIEDKMKEKESKLTEKLEESRQMRQILQNQEAAIKGAIKKKIDDIRKCNIPEKYVKEVERHLKLL